MIEKKLENSAIHYWTNTSNVEKSIVFLHPAFANHTCFDEQVKFFSDRYKLIIPDLIGHGKSIGEGSIADTANDIIAIMEAERIEKINLVGISMGAMLASDFANKYPEKLNSLCCIGGYDINNLDSSFQKDVGGKQMKMVLLGMFSIKKFAEENKKTSAYTVEAQEKFYQMNLEFKKSSFRYLSDLGSLMNKYKTAHRTYPLLIGVGEYDNEMAIKAAKQWSENEPEAKYVVFQNAGHIVNMDIPHEFNEELSHILS